MVVQKTICWRNLGCTAADGSIHSEAGTGSSCSVMTQHYPTTSAAAAVWASGQVPVSAMLFHHTSAYYLPEH